MEAELKLFENKLVELVARLRDDFSGIRTNKPTTKLVEDIKVNYYGQDLPIKAVGTTSISPPRDIIISVWDKGAVPVVAKAIEDAQLGMTPNIDGNSIRLSLPTLTDERKVDLIKIVKKTTEDHRIRVRQMRDEINKVIKKAEDEDALSENNSFKNKGNVQKAVDKTNEAIERLLVDKIKEIEE
ncbi:MAG: ribosome recycling factor [bacterium]|nr:ribosome recycling factor [bacterium]